MIPSSTQLPPSAEPISPPVSTAGNGHTEKVTENPELQKLQDSFSTRLEQAKSELSQNPEAREALSDALVNNFCLFQDNENNDSNIENKNNFLALALAQCNLANREDIDKLQQVIKIQDDIIQRRETEEAELQSNEMDLKALEGELGATSRQDNANKSGSYSMVTERQGFVEKQVESWFQEDTRQPVKDALMLLKNQITSGADIGSLPKSITTLKFGKAEDLANFSANFRYPNPDIFSQARHELLSKSSELEQHFANAKDLVSVLQGKVSEDKLGQVIQALSRPVSEMGTEALVLAAILTPFTESDLKSYLKAAQILLLKTEAQKENPELADNTAIAIGLERSDAMVREHYKADPKHAASSAANALVKSQNPLPGNLTAIA
ncbi:hypothetical protein [Endozoicomonas sp. SCSIO W0465]|uniref:hypothetical protein n=1 Tax=Endozoicomonas sp. SCSIO W0465 TaxID=2918516 RepID=UPI002075F0C5|nr:hypothetical protein [Endozoicomonas sp. SCSIO W0465]USE34933.1 hypothetical protein MJO57_22840 [Endozoicomonas sp. SCSIO W0465]